MVRADPHARQPVTWGAVCAPGDAMGLRLTRLWADAPGHTPRVRSPL